MKRTSTLSKYILLLGLLIASVDSYAQCNTEIRAVRDTIACGESLLLTNITLSNSPTSDNFSGSTLGGLWAAPGSVSNGWTLTSPCGATPTGQNLWFAQGSVIPRKATTINIDASCGGTVCFDFRMETQSAPPCDGPDQPNEAIYVQYKNNTTGGAWTTFQTFLPGALYTGWNNYCYPIPVGATAGGAGNQVQFRWIQLNASTSTYDLWGIDNVDISLSPPCGIPYSTTFFGSNVPAAYTFDTLTVTPYTDSAIYSVFVSNTFYSCTDSFTVYVEQPSIISQLLGSSCTGTDTLDAEATITANCDYTVELINFNPGGGPSSGWSTGATPPTYHNLDVNVNGSLYSNFTMVTGINGATIPFPIAVTDGDLLETYFTSLGSYANECAYKIYDSQGIVANTGLGTPAYTGVGGTPLNTYFNTQLAFTVVNGGSGYNLFPYSPANPTPTITLSGGGCSADSVWANSILWSATPPSGYIASVIATGVTGCISAPTVTVTGGGGSGAIITAALVDNAVHVTCPATATYNYSWTNITSGGVAGLSDPNIQNPLATVALGTDFQVTAFDSLHPLCIAIDTVFVPFTGNSITATMISSNDTICNGDPVVLNFTLVGTAPFSLELFINGIPNPYILDAAGLLPSGLPLTFNPIINTTYSVGTLSDVSGCPASVTDPTLDVVINFPPNAGGDPVSVIEYCQGDPVVNISDSLIVPVDAGGEWTDWTGAVVFNGLNFIFNPANPTGTPISFAPGDTTFEYTYTVSSPPCLDDIATVTIKIINSAIAGVLTSDTNMCMGGATPFDLNSLFTIPPNPLVYNWTDISSGTPGSPQSNNFTPPNSGIYTFRNTVPSSNPLLCANAIADVTVTVHALPTAFISVSDNFICSGDRDTLNFLLTGAAPFTITYDITDINGVTPNNNVVLNSSGNDTTTGLPIEITPLITTTYTIQNNVDSFGCISTAIDFVTVTVTPQPDAGISKILTPLCSDDITIIPLQGILGLGGAQDMTGSWKDPLGNSILPASANLDFSLSTMNPGIYTYTVQAAPCPDAIETITIDTLRPPNAGTANPQSICINNYDNINPYDLYNLLNNPDLIGGLWTDVTNGINIPSGTINPNAYATIPASIQTITFRYEVTANAPICPNDFTQVNLTINPEPVVNTFTSNVPIIAQGSPVVITADMLIGTAPFTIGFEDDFTPPNPYTININPPLMMGSTTTTGGPNVIPVTTYNITSVTDANMCTTTAFPAAVMVTVDPYPIVDPFLAATPVICVDDNAFIQMTLTQGEAPITVNYLINGISFTYILGSIGQLTPYISPLISIALSDLNIGNNPIIVTSVTDNSGVSTPSSLLPAPINITVNPLPELTFSTSTNPICLGDSAILDFGFLVGSAPFTIDYRINNANQTPLPILGTGNQSHLIIPGPSVGPNTYEVINVTDSNGCDMDPTIPLSVVTIKVNEIPNISLAISGKNPICLGEISELFFQPLSGLAPFNVWYTENGTTATVLIDDLGYEFATSVPKPISPAVTTTYTLTSVSDSNTCVNNNVNTSDTLVVNELPQVTIGGTAEICNEKITQLYFNFTAGKSQWVLDYAINGIPMPTPITHSNIIDSIPVAPNVTTVYTFNNIIDSNLCTSLLNDAITITVNPLPEVVISGGGSICDDGSTTDVIFNTTSGSPTYIIEYSIGSDNHSTPPVGYQYSIPTNTSGIYTIKNIEDINGCIGKNISGSAQVIVNPMPKVNFTAYPQPTDINDPVIYFVDQSAGYTSGVWSFGDGDSSATNFYKVHHTYKDTGRYLATLMIATDSGCTVLKPQTIIINQAFTLYIPNSFTPNTDLRNDHFLPIVDGVQEYQLSIYDRLGGRIFETTDFTNQYCVKGCSAAWDGKINNGELAASGSYLYAIVVTDLNGKEQTFEGMVTLVR